MAKVNEVIDTDKQELKDTYVQAIADLQQIIDYDLPTVNNFNEANGVFNNIDTGMKNLARIQKNILRLAKKKWG